MSDETTTTTEQPAAEPETKRSRTVWPITICRLEAGALTPIKDAPQFNEADKANDWIKANAKAGETYKPARLGPTLRVRQVVEVVE